MMWLNPWAAIGLFAIAGPILVHLLTARRPRPVAFPTLRFVTPTPLAALRRHRLDDLILLVVRTAILAAAVMAFMGPLALTAGRRATWNARSVRAIIVDTGDRASDTVPQRRETAVREAAQAFRSTIIEAADLRDGVRQAVSWLDSGPPGRREVVVLSAFALGAIRADVVGEIPAGTGVRLVRVGRLPGVNVQPGWDIVWAGDADARVRTVGLRDAFTTVTEQETNRGQPIPIEITTSPNGAAAAHAALSAVLDTRVPAPAAGRHAVIAVGDDAAPAALRAEPLSTAWIADAAARIARNDELRLAGANVDCSQSGDRLVVTTRAPAESTVTPLLIRAVFDAMQPLRDSQRAEVVPLSDAALRAFERPAAKASRPDRRSVDEDDRRWAWAGVLMLMVLEAAVRRSRVRARRGGAEQEANARVA